MAGVDQNTETPELYWIDYLGTFCKVPYAAHGYAAYFSLSIMDKCWNNNIDFDTGCSIMKKCIAEIQKRFIIQHPKIKVRVVTKDGCKDVAI